MLVAPGAVSNRSLRIGVIALTGVTIGLISEVSGAIQWDGSLGYAFVTNCE